jgi:N-formylmaleamate deformylase
MAHEISEHDFLVQGIQYHYYRLADISASAKPVLVLQHGFSDNGLCWAPVAEELTADFDILMPDARGHGKSARIQKGDQIDQAAELFELMQALGVRQAVVAGHSMGAQIASNLAARYPEFVRALILEDPPWFIPDPDAPPQKPGSMEDSPLGQWMRSLKDLSLEQIMEQCRVDHPAWPDNYLRPWCQGKKELDLNFLTLERSWGTSWQEDVKLFKCPVLLITADPSQGGIVTPAVERIATGLNPKIQVANFPGIGHHIRFAMHEPYMTRVKAFLKSL